MAARMTWLTEDEKRAVYATALHILETVGIRLAGSRALQPLAEAGATVDHVTGVARLPAALVERAVAGCPRAVLMAGETPEADVCLDGSRTHFNPSGSVATTLDHVSGALRPSTLADVRDGTIVLDATEEVDVMWTFATANDVPLERRAGVELYTYLTESRKHLALVDCPSEAAGVRGAAEVVAGDLERFRARPRLSVLCSVASPLEVNGDLLDVTLDLAAMGCPVWVYSLAICGATGPVTPAGTLALVWAEILGATSAIETAVPGAPILACCGPGILDMRATSLSQGSLENTLMGAAGVEIGHMLGLPVHNSGLATDAVSVGVQAGYEKGLKLAAAVATGADMISGGFTALNSASTLYLPMIPVDAEIAAMARRMAEGIEVTPATLMGDAIERVGIGGDFLKEKETRRRVRQGEHFMPIIAGRGPTDRRLAAGVTELDRAREVVRAALDRRQERGPYLSDDQRRELAALCGVSPDGAPA